MCGRYASTAGEEAIEKEFGVTELVGDALPPSWNIAPTQPARIVLERSAGDDGSRPRQLHTAAWGLLPSWAPDRKSAASRINARVETVTTKPAYRSAVTRRRALVPAAGYYEWQRDAGAKRPHFLSRPGELLAFAALYEWWRDPERPEDDPDRWVLTFTVLTQPAPDALGHIHDRSPVLVPPELRDRWLSRDVSDADSITALLASLPEPALVPMPVNDAVSSVRNDGPHLLDPPAPPTPAAADLLF